MRQTQQVIAAGGVIISEGADNERLVLVVHRARYDDWSLPKGKLEPGEGIEAAAVREVEEETGLRCRIVQKIHESRYAYTTKTGEPQPKVVHFFLMEPTGGRLEIAGDEVDDARWLPIAKARALLSYDNERDILAELKNRLTGL